MATRYQPMPTAGSPDRSETMRTATPVVPQSRAPPLTARSPVRARREVETDTGAAPEVDRAGRSSAHARSPEPASADPVAVGRAQATGGLMIGLRVTSSTLGAAAPAFAIGARRNTVLPRLGHRPVPRGTRMTDGAPDTPAAETATPVPPALAVARQSPDRNLALELVRVTEAAAMAAGRWVGRGDKMGGDGAAVDAMRALIGTVSMRGIVVIGEGEKDEAPMLFNGEHVGDGHGAEFDFAVDPIDGTTLMAKGMPNAIAVMAVADRGAMYDPSAVFYMEKLATGPEAADVVDITVPVAENIRRVAKAKLCSTGDVTVCILDRPRHEQLVSEVREAGARIKFITDGDVAGAIAAAREGTGVDLLLGIGGTPEGIIAARALKGLSGSLHAKR